MTIAGRRGERRAAAAPPAPTARDQRELRASCAGRPGRRRRPSRLARNGATPAPRGPSGSRPPRRAIVGSSAPTRAVVTPDADRRDRDRATCCAGTAQSIDRIAGRPAHRRTSQPPSGLRGELTGSALGLAVAVGPRFAPRGFGSPVLGRRFGRVTIPAGRGEPQRCVPAASRWSHPRACYHPRSESRYSVLWGCVVSTGLGYRGTRAEDAAQASLIRQQNEVPGNRQSTLALAA